MRISKAILAMFAAASFAAALAPQAFSAPANDELDHSAVPQGLIVRQDAQGNREIFRAAIGQDVKTSADAVKAISTFVTPENKITSVKSGSELDRTSSTDSWYGWYNPYYSNYGYYYYSYYTYANYSYYYPYYSYYAGGFSYYYYYSSYYYGGWHW